MRTLEREHHARPDQRPEASSPGDCPAAATGIRPAIGLNRALAIGTAICTLLFLLGVSLGTWAATGELVDGLGVGFFAAAWGGPGFGLMAGGAAYTISQERVARAEARLARPAAPAEAAALPAAVGHPAGWAAS